MARVQIHEQAMNQLLRSSQGAVARDLFRRALRVQAKSRTLVGVDTGRLKASITVNMGFAEGRPAVEIGSNVEYALYHHEGVGIYGSGQPIRPRNATVLRFKPKGSNIVVFARQVRGYPGTKYLTRALDAAQ